MSDFTLVGEGGSATLIEPGDTIARRFASRYEGIEAPGQQVMAGVCIVLLLSSLATEVIGIHTLFGAFLIGAVIPHDSTVARLLRERLYDFAVVMLLPIAARPLSSAVGRPLAALLGMPGRLGRENSMRNPRRTAQTAAALMIGLTVANYGYPIAQLMALPQTNVPAVYVGAGR